MDNKPKKLIWIVEDDTDQSFLLEERLHYNGYATRSFPTADAAIIELEKLKYSTDQKPDLIITDYNTKSNNSGLDVIKAAAAKELGIRSIILSANDIEHVAMAHGAVGFFRKPYDNKELVAKVNKVIAMTPESKESQQVSR